MIIDVFLLAAGEASRMFPLNSIIEKSLLPVDGKPVIRHIVEKLEKCEQIEKIVVCCLKKFHKQFVHEFRDLDIQFRTFERPIGTFNTYFEALMGYTTQITMVHYADCLTDIDYNDFISKFDDKFEGMIAVTDKVRHDYSEVINDESLRILEFREKPFLTHYSWSGIGLFKTAEMLKYSKTIHEYERTDFAKDIFPEMIQKKKLKAYPYHGEWVDIGNLNAYRKVSNLYINGGGDTKF